MDQSQQKENQPQIVQNQNKKSQKSKKESQIGSDKLQKSNSPPQNKKPSPQKSIKSLQFLHSVQKLKLKEERKKEKDDKNQFQFEPQLTYTLSDFMKNNINGKSRQIFGDIFAHQILKIIDKQSSLPLHHNGQFKFNLTKQNKYKIRQDLNKFVSDPISNQFTKGIEILTGEKDKIINIIINKLQQIRGDFDLIFDGLRKYGSTYKSLIQQFRGTMSEQQFWLIQNIIGQKPNQHDQTLFFAEIKRNPFTSKIKKQQLINQGKQLIEQQTNLLQNILQIIKLVIASQFMDNLRHRIKCHNQIDNLFQYDYKTHFDQKKIIQQKIPPFLPSKKCLIYFVNNRAKKQKVHESFVRYLRYFDGWFKKRKTIVHIIGFNPMSPFEKSLFQKYRETDEELKVKTEKLQKADEQLKVKTEKLQKADEQLKVKTQKLQKADEELKNTIQKLMKKINELQEKIEGKIDKQHGKL